MSNIELVPNSDVYVDDKRNTKKMLLETDAVCVDCGAIFNAYYEDSCVICDIPGGNDDVQNVCKHEEFIVGRESVDLRILLDYHMEDLKALCEVHGCSEAGGRGKMAINIMKKLHPALDKRIDELLIRKMIKRNSRRFRFWKDIKDAISRAKKSEKIRLVSADECMELVDIPGLNKDDKNSENKGA